MHGSAIILIVLVYFIIIVTVLTLLWRITIALDLIAKNLQDISKTLADKKEK